MKNLKIFALILFVGAIAFSSCKKDDPTGPTISVTPVNADAEKGTVVSFDYTISSNEKIKELTATPDNAIISAQTVTTFNGDFSATGTVEFTLPSSSLNAGDVINIVFKATDDSGDEYAAETTVKITIVAGANPITTYSAKLMGAQSNATLGSFMDIETGTVYLSSAAATNQSLVDLVYYYGTTNLATFCAPNDVTVGGGTGNLSLCASWTTKNATTFSTTTITASEFDAMTDDASFVSSTGTKVTSVAIGDVIAFETVGGKKGLIKVSAMTTGSTGDVTIDVKVQQ